MAWAATPLRIPAATINPNPMVGAEEYFAYRVSGMPNLPWYAFSFYAYKWEARVQGEYNLGSITGVFDGYQEFIMEKPTSELDFATPVDSTDPGLVMSCDLTLPFEINKVIGGESPSGDFVVFGPVFSGTQFENGIQINTNFGLDLASGIFGSVCNVSFEIWSRSQTDPPSYAVWGTAHSQFFSNDVNPYIECGSLTIKVPAIEGGFISQSMPMYQHTSPGNLSNIQVTLTPIGQSDNPLTIGPFTDSVFPYSPTGSETDPLRKWNQDATFNDTTTLPGIPPAAE